MVFFFECGLFYNDEFPENILGYENSVLWTKNPTDDFLQLLINISNRIENSRVIGDDGEWYVSLNDIWYLEEKNELKVNFFLCLLIFKIIWF